MTSLEELRTQLSDVDDQITDLYEKRMKICEDLGTCKIKNGYKTFDRQREKNKIAEVMGKVSSDFNKKGIGEVYELLLAISRKLQYKQLVEAGALGRLPFIGIDSLDKDVTAIMYIHSGRQWRQLKKARQIMQYFRLKIQQREQ